MWLLDKVRGFLESDHDERRRQRIGAQADLEIRAATAVLLLEAAYGDTEYVWREHHTIVKALEREFGLGRKETLELLGRAAEIRPPVVKLADVTSVLRDRLDRDQRKEVAALVRQVVRADGVVGEWEQVFADHVAQAVGLGEGERREASERSV
jgi:uncharacterized tellurite resistance protein B-like protein